MAGRSRFVAALLAALVLTVSLVAAGCAAQGAFSRTKDGKYQYTEGSDVWTWDQKGSTAQITLNDKLFAVIQSGEAQVSLPDGRSVEVTLDKNNAPVTIKTAWGVQLTQKDYTQMNSAFSVSKSAGGQSQPGSLGGIVVLLLFIVGGVLLFLNAGSLVSTWKLGGIFSGNDTAKSLLLIKALGILVIVVSAVILLLVLF